MVIFHCYVSSPEGMFFSRLHPWFHTNWKPLRFWPLDHTDHNLSSLLILSLCLLSWNSDSSLIVSVESRRACLGFDLLIFQLHDLHYTFAIAFAQSDYYIPTVIASLSKHGPLTAKTRLRGQHGWLDRTTTGWLDAHPGNMCKTLRVGLRENLEETMVFTIKY